MLALLGAHHIFHVIRISANPEKRSSTAQFFNQVLCSDYRSAESKTMWRSTRFIPVLKDHRTALQSHQKPLMEQILAPPNSRRLLRRWTP